jgi:hypothetical protein
LYNIIHFRGTAQKKYENCQQQILEMSHLLCK